MKNYKRLTKWKINKFSQKNEADLKNKKNEPIVAITRLAELEDKIENGELGNVKEKEVEIARLTVENAELRARLRKEGFSYKVGDKVYIIKDEVVYEKTISEILLIFEYHDFNEPYTHITSDTLLYNLGKTIFTDPDDVKFLKNNKEYN